jgi:hypothetical protein
MALGSGFGLIVAGGGFFHGTIGCEESEQKQSGKCGQ